MNKRDVDKLKEVQWRSSKLLREVKYVTCEERLREWNFVYSAEERVNTG